jgi:hypothetical protein
MGDTRREVPIDEAISRIGDGDQIHIFRSTSFALLGADWDREDLIEAMRKSGVVEAGPQACAVGHTLAIENNGGSPLFIEAQARDEAEVRDAERAATPAASNAP